MGNHWCCCWISKLHFICINCCIISKNMGKLSGRSVTFTIISVLLSGMVVFIYFNFNPIDSRWFPQCFIKTLTGWSCPSCGVQRALHSLLHGNWREALSYNYFFVISIPYTILICMAYGLRRMKRAGYVSDMFEHRSLAMIYVFCFFAWFIMRNILDI